jgi:hypothetical protein
MDGRMKNKWKEYLLGAIIVILVITSMIAFGVGWAMIWTGE